MIIKTYGIYDSVAKTLRSTFTSENDETALRASIAVAKEPKADKSTLKDCIVRYLYSVDSQTGNVVDVDQHDVCVFASFIDDLKLDINPESLDEIKELVEKVKQSYIAVGDSIKTLDNANGTIFARLESLEKKIDGIIGGTIKCQRYHKPKK